MNEINARVKAIRDRYDDEMHALSQEVFQQRTYPDGCRVRRVRYNTDGSVYDDITGVVVGSGVFVCDDYPCVQYWVRVETPADYYSHQMCPKFGLEMGKAEDFWEGDERWGRAA